MDTRPAAAGAGTAADGDLSVAVNFDYEQAGELKIGQVGIANLRIRTLDVERLVQEMRERVTRAPKLFGRAAVILDFGGLRSAGVLPVALAYGTSAVDLLSQQLGLPLLAKFRAQYERAEGEPAPPPPAQEPRRAAHAEPKPAPATPVAKVADAAAPQPGRMQLGNVRSGQQLYAENCDLTVMATVGAGAEVIADGSIHIYGTLRGRALAGAQGNTAARIFCRDFHAELVAIAGHYKVLDDVPDNLRGKAVQVWLEQDQIKIAALD